MAEFCIQAIIPTYTIMCKSIKIWKHKFKYYFCIDICIKICSNNLAMDLNYEAEIKQSTV